jgi:uncharacterized membrane protein
VPVLAKANAKGLSPWLVAVLLVYSYTLWLMIEITLQYTSLGSSVAFLAIKQDYVSRPHFKTAFYVHVFSAILVLPAGYTQFSTRIRKFAPQLHRRMGWLYVGVTLLLAGPSGFVLGVYANGGLSSQIAFCLLALAWMFCTYRAVQSISQRQIGAHRAWMMRSFSLALSAITLRAWKYVLVWAFQPRPMDLYRVVAWLGWTLNLIVVEWILYHQSRKNRTKGDKSQ